MSYEDRIKESYWISPFEKEKRTPKKIILKANSFDEGFTISKQTINNTGDGANILPFGANAEQFPVSCVFFGENHDIEAGEFYKLLKEDGVGLLQLPYGDEKLVTVDKVSKKYNIVKGRNITTIKVIFIEETQILSEGDRLYIKTRLNDLASTASESIAEFFSDKLDINTAGDKNSILSSFNNGITKINSTLKPLVANTKKVVTEFTAVYSNIESNIDEVVSQPLLLAQQVMRLKEIPARIIGKFSETKNAYETLFTASLPDFFTIGGMLTREKKNDVVNAMLFSGASIIGMADALVNVDYTTKSEAIGAIDVILDNYKTFVDYFDTAQNEFEAVCVLNKQFIQDESVTADINKYIESVVGTLIEISQDLKREFEFELDKDTTILNIATEYYPEEIKKNEQEGSQDILEYIISNNKLKNDEILLLPKGKIIKVYI